MILTQVAADVSRQFDFENEQTYVCCYAELKI